jgi:hypothetical protein
MKLDFDMVKNSSVLLLLFFTACLNGPHDNRYDPLNPDKATISGYVWVFDSTILNDAVISLMQKGDVIETDTSDDLGYFNIANIDPGIYTVRMKGRYYKPIELSPESLWAGTCKIFSITANSFFFEEDQDGTTEPYSFRVMNGNWQVADDFTEPNFHTTPHVYRGVYHDTGGFSLAVCEKNIKNFFVQTSLIVSRASSTGWKAGIVFRYRDDRNYYLLQIDSDTARFYKVLADSWILKDKREEKFSTDVWSTISIRCMNEQTLCYVNDNFQFTVLDSSFANGGVGFWVSNRFPGETTAVNFDDPIFYPDIPDTIH